MKRFVNLVPDDHRRRILTRRLLSRWLGILTVGIFCLFGYVVFEREAMTRHTNLRLGVEAKVRPYMEMSDAVKRMNQEIKSIEQNDAILRRLLHEGSPILPVAVVSQGAKACAGRVWVRRLSFEASSPEGDENTNRGPQPGSNANAQAPAEEFRQQLVVEGIAADNLAVADFVSALRETGAFRSVELRSALSTNMNNAVALTFAIEGEL